MKLKKTIILFISLFFISSCTTYNVRDLSTNNETHMQDSQCYPKFYLSISSSRYTNSFGENKTPENGLEEFKTRYVDCTKKLLNNNSCNAIYAETENEADLIIHIKRTLFLSALPQEWLTGLSLGIIPSWSTRRDQLSFIFKDVHTKKVKEYTVDIKFYAHLFLIFASFKQDAMTQELDSYVKSFNMFIKSS
jgi:hypothetical protein